MCVCTPFYGVFELVIGPSVEYDIEYCILFNPRCILPEINLLSVPAQVISGSECAKRRWAVFAHELCTGDESATFPHICTYRGTAYPVMLQ